MALTLRCAMKAEPLRNFRVAAGAGGFDRRLAAVNILDYEYDGIGEADVPRGLFQRGAFVLTSFLFAKNRPQLVLPALRALVRDGAAAVAVKTVCLAELPREAAEFADQADFPVLFFDNCYFEDVIVAVSAQIRQHNDFEALERSAAALAENGLSRSDVRSLAAELKLPAAPFASCCCLSSNAEAEDFYARFADAERLCGGAALVLPYKGRLLFTMRVLEGSPAAAAARLLARAGLPAADYFVGTGGLHTEADEFDYSLIESVCACERAVRLGLSSAEFGAMGLERLTAPLASSHWLASFCDSMLKPLREFDDKHAAELLPTLRAYVASEGDAAAAAALLHIHKNTVHYRLSQIKTLLDAGEGFYEQAALAVRCEPFVHSPKS